MADEGIIYVLSNLGMPGLIKIGKTTTSPEQRMSNLYTTGVPFPFHCEYAVRVAEVSKVEKALHYAFEPHRVNERREFFKLHASHVESILELLALEVVTPAVQKDIDSEVDAISQSAAESYRRKQRPTFNFLEMGISIGEKIEFQGGGDTTFEAEIAGERLVKYEGKEYSLSGLSKQLLGMDKSKTLDGKLHWLYEGKPLEQIYNETYPYLDE